MIDDYRYTIIFNCEICEKNFKTIAEYLVRLEFMFEMWCLNIVFVWSENTIHNGFPMTWNRFFTWYLFQLYFIDFLFVGIVRDHWWKDQVRNRDPCTRVELELKIHGRRVKLEPEIRSERVKLVVVHVVKLCLCGDDDLVMDHLLSHFTTNLLSATFSPSYFTMWLELIHTKSVIWM